ncbi:PspA/IM30 family protein [Rubritalea tangerina]|uniref:PspA/IM30 family protein n=1 Tax=Rubritalea tangerina TaxID=430798 RepID=A0ABW4ZEK2_9BACT
MFKRLGNLIKGFFGLFIGGLEKRSPEALLEVEKENLRKQIAQFNQGLASHAGLVEKLISEVKKLDKQENELRAKTAAHLKAGNRQLAGDFALKLKKVEGEHDDVKEQLEDAEKHYKELIRARDVSVKEARAKIEELRRGIDDMKVKKAVAELNEMASGMISDIGGSGDNLNRLGEIVEEERTKAAGRARVARDSMDLTEVNMKQEEQDALAEMALADFAAAEGIEIEKTETKAPAKTEGQPSSSQGTMGPGVTE